MNTKVWEFVFTQDPDWHVIIQLLRTLRYNRYNFKSSTAQFAMYFFPDFPNNR